MKIIDYKNIPDEFFAKIEFESLESVAKIIDDVKKDGDSAVRKYSQQFDGCTRESFLLTKQEIDEAYSKVDEKTIDALTYAIKNVKEFAQKQLHTVSNLDTTVDGNKLGHRIVPLEKVGCYIPGGNYPLPSTAFMTIVPAKVAGVKEVVACSPRIQPVTVVACDLAGADKIFAVGGVQAVAAMAYGTQSITNVNKIVGPGNKYVTSAKKQVFGECGIDFLAGPSEVLIIADETAKPEFVAADMLAQCEHDLDARAYLVCFSKEFAQQVGDYAEKFMQELKTSDIARKAWDKSYAVLVDDIAQAIEISEQRAPEHLELCIKDAENYIDKFTNYGSLFIGNYSAEVFGDYASGTNHTLPTNQVAKYSGGLSVFDYIKIQTYQIINPDNSKQLMNVTELLASKEGLEAHSLAAKVRKRS